MRILLAVSAALCRYREGKKSIASWFATNSIFGNPELHRGYAFPERVKFFDFAWYASRWLLRKSSVTDTVLTVTGTTASPKAIMLEYQSESRIVRHDGHSIYLATYEGLYPLQVQPNPPPPLSHTKNHFFPNTGWRCTSDGFSLPGLRALSELLKTDGNT